MKTTFLILALLLLSLGLNANPPDSCLWVPTGVQLVSVINGKHVDNRDSTLYIDTCGLYLIDPTIYIDSLGNHRKNPSVYANSTYIQHKRYYSKSVWVLYFELSSFAFDTTNKDLDNMYYFTIDDMNSNNDDFFKGFQNVKSKYGNIKFWLSHKTNLTINEVMKLPEYKNGVCFIETENLVNSIEFADYINYIPNVSCDFGSEIVYPVSDVQENNQSDIKFRISTDFNDLEIISNEILNNVFIYSFDGSLLWIASNSELKSLLNTNNLKVDISYLSSGAYFIKVNNSFDKFIIAR